MALKRNERYPGRFDSPTSGQPQGAFKNRSAPGAKDGSYLEKDWMNDFSAFFSSLLSSASITPNGSVDAVGASQYYSALLSVISSALVIPDASVTAKGIVELATLLESQAGSDATRAVTPSGLAGVMLGMGGQAWQDVTGSRAINTTYTNSTGRPIVVVVNSATGSTATLSVGAVVVGRVSQSTGGLGYQLSAIVPAGGTYTYTTLAGNLNSWVELRG